MKLDFALRRHELKRQFESSSLREIYEREIVVRRSTIASLLRQNVAFIVSEAI